MSNRPRTQPPLDDLIKQATADPDGLERRGKQGNLAFAASAFAMRGACDCKACVYLRQAVDILLAVADEVVGADAPRNSS